MYLLFNNCFQIQNAKIHFFANVLEKKLQNTKPKYLHTLDVKEVDTRTAYGDKKLFLPDSLPVAAADDVIDGHCLACDTYDF